jgi:hypothetical protein
MAAHDPSYKVLFSHRNRVADLIRGFVQEEWVAELDFAPCSPRRAERASGSATHRSAGAGRRFCRLCGGRRIGEGGRVADRARNDARTTDTALVGFLLLPQPLSPPEGVAKGRVAASWSLRAGRCSRTIACVIRSWSLAPNPSPPRGRGGSCASL